MNQGVAIFRTISIRQAQGRFDEEKASIRSLMTLHLCQPIRESFCNFREELASSQQEVQRKDGVIDQIRVKR